MRGRSEQYLAPHRCGGSCCAGGALWVQRCQCPYELFFLQNGQADLREKIYQKLLRLGASYKEQVNTSQVVQVAVEGVDQLETYFGAYLPQFFYAMLAPLTLFGVLAFINLPSAAVLLVCVPLIPVTIAGVQRWAKNCWQNIGGSTPLWGIPFWKTCRA